MSPKDGFIWASAPKKAMNYNRCPEKCIECSVNLAENNCCLVTN